FFSSESVSEGHPDKVADQISDAILDNILAQDKESKVACETLVTTGQVILAGELKTTASINEQDIARRVIKKIGYTKSDYKFDSESCGILNALHGQSPDINRGVERSNPYDQGAGDQGMMFGYACNETQSLMPIALDMSHNLLWELAEIRREGKQMTYLRPDSKSQVTIEYGDDNKPKRVDTIVISTQHDEFIQDEKNQLKADEEMVARIKKDVETILIPRLLSKHEEYKSLLASGYKLLVNPTGKFVIGGPYGDTGLTGRKIIVDTYGGKGAHGGGAFSGKDPSKVDRSAAYAARHLAKNLVAAGLAEEVLVQVAYAIGVAEPMNLFINTYGTSKVNMSDGEMAKKIAESKIFDMRPKAIEDRLKLRNPIYEETASYGHMGRIPQVVTKSFTDRAGNTFTKEVELFTWEKTDKTADLKKLFGL
ncbi:MAG: methionine adenosyltransferase, partial [Paludibacteraceae bacterium]|nr:methionine adenosyltransferase [Paludibacteraceae bacterium]